MSFELRPDINKLKSITDNSRSEEIEHMNDPKLGWGVYDSRIEDYHHSFKKVLPENYPYLSDYIAGNYNNKKGELIGIELGGPGNELFNKLAPGYFKKTAGFTLIIPQNNTGAENHQMIEADVFNRRSKDDKDFGYQEVQSWEKENGKADIIIERMVAPIHAPESDHLLLIIKRWYKLLGTEGTFFLQLPKDFDYKDEIETFLEKNKNKFDYQIAEMDFPIPGYFIRLRKLSDAPDSLDELLKK